MTAGLGNQARIILFLGRLHQIKGIHHLIEAFALLSKEILDAALVIAGPDEGELANLQALTHRLQLQERVHFVGPLYGRNKLAALVDADVLAYPAAYEIFGLVPFEAILCGTPVIVTESSGAGGLIAEAQAGYLAPYADVSRLAEILRRALASPQESGQMVVAGQRYIRENLDWNKILNQYEKLYTGCIPGDAP